MLIIFITIILMNNVHKNALYINNLNKLLKIMFII